MANEALTVEIQGMNSLVKWLDPKKFDKATVNTLNVTATKFRKDVLDKSAKLYNIQKKRIKKDSTGKDTSFIRRASRSAHFSRVEFRGKRPGLQHFSSNKQMINRKTSPKYKLLKSDPLKVVDRGFFQDAKGSRGLFQRADGVGRWPIDRRSGPSLKQMYEESLQTDTEKLIPKWLQEAHTRAIIKQFR